MNTDITFHYPPELFNLMVDTIPLLFKSKKDVVLFFRGAGVSLADTADLMEKVETDRQGINKYEIVRVVLTRINEKGEANLGQRREVLKRICDFDNFSTCWPNDRLKAKGLVSEIRDVVNVKDSFTRISQERDEVYAKSKAVHVAKAEKALEHRTQIETIKADFYKLFSEMNPQKRGKQLEGVLNRLFHEFGILIREAFVLKSSEKEGIVEQIDGAVEIEGKILLGRNEMVG